MNAIKKKALLLLLFIFGISAMSAQNYRVIGSVSGIQNAGEMFELYKSSADSFREYLAGWRHLGSRDDTKDFSYDQINKICLEQAKREYGRYYSNIDVIGLKYDIDYEYLEDEEYYSNVVGSSAQYRKKDRQQKIYKYSATVISYE